MRIALTKKKFLDKRELLSADLDLETRKKLIKTLIWSVATYGAETQIMKNDAKRRIQFRDVVLEVSAKSEVDGQKD